MLALIEIRSIFHLILIKKLKKLKKEIEKYFSFKKRYRNSGFIYLEFTPLMLDLYYLILKITPSKTASKNFSKNP